MNAAGIAAALGDALRIGHCWRCRCPVHGGRSLTLRDGDGGRLLVTCWGGCNRVAVLAELHRLGLLDRHSSQHRAPVTASPREDQVGRRVRALRIWREARPAAKTIVSAYLQSRGISLEPWPATLRFHPSCPR